MAESRGLFGEAMAKFSRTTVVSWEFSALSWLGQALIAALHRLPVFGLVVQFDHAAGALLLRVDHAGVKGAGIDVQAYRPLAEFTGIVDPVDGLQRIDGAGLEWVHFHRAG